MIQFLRLISISIFIINSLSQLNALDFWPMPIAWQWTHEGNSSFLATPIDADCNVIIAGGQRVFCLKKEDSKILWRYPIKETTTEFFIYTPLLNDNLVFLTTDQDTIIAVNRFTAEEKWRYRSYVGIKDQPLLIGNFIVIPTKESSIEAINASTGKSVWETPHRIFDGIYGQLGSYKSSIISFTKANKLFSLDIITREVDWVVPLRQIPINSRIKPIVYGERIYVIDGYLLIAFNALTGNVIWQRNFGEFTIESPIVSQYGIAITTETGKLIVFDLSGNRFKSSSFLIGANNVKAVWAENKIIIYDPRNVLQLIDPIDNKLLWTYHILPTTLTGSETRNQITVPLFSIDSLYVWSRENGLFNFNKNFGIDKTGPKINMTFPNQGDDISTSNNSALTFQLEDMGSGINPKSIKVFIDGSEKNHIYYINGKLIIGFGDRSGNHSLLNGRKLIKIIASDWVNNVSESIFVFYVNNNMK